MRPSVVIAGLSCVISLTACGKSSQSEWLVPVAVDPAGVTSQVGGEAVPRNLGACLTGKARVSVSDQNVYLVGLTGPRSEAEEIRGCLDAVSGYRVGIVTRAPAEG